MESNPIFQRVNQKEISASSDQIQFEMVPQNDHQNGANVVQNDKLEKGLQKFYATNDYFLREKATLKEIKSESNENNDNNQEKSDKQGTLTGVFLPVMQNIFGVLIFIRVPEITGQAGWFHSFLIVLICCLCTFLTTLSLSAIATNGKIKQGGTYYILGRSLGPGVGTAVGFCFYLGNTFAGAMYILGAVEAFITSTGVSTGYEQLDMRLFGAILLVILICINLIGIQYVSKTGVLFLGVVILGILCMYIGSFVAHTRDDLLDGIDGLSDKNFSDNFDPDPESDYSFPNSFFGLLAIYFPSVTGIMAGANRSGDLKDPSASLPKGTLSAQLITSFVYASMPILMGGVAQRFALLNKDVLFAAEMSWPTKYLVIVAIILSSTGAGLQSLASAPRLMARISEDQLLPFTRFFYDKSQTPKKAIALTAIICFCAVMIGEIDSITPIITMFFLMCYSFVNLCCLFLEILKFPNWRPTWKYFHSLTSLLGLLECIFLMIMISWWAFLIALAFAVSLFLYVQRQGTSNKNFGDSIEAVKLVFARGSILSLTQSLTKAQKHVKNWIPIVLVVGDVSEDQKVKSHGLLDFLRSIRNDVALAFYGSTITNAKYDENDFQKKKKIEDTLQTFFQENDFLFLQKVLLTDSYNCGLKHLIQAVGIGGLEPNTIGLSFPENHNDKQEAERFVEVIRYSESTKHAVFVCMNDQNFIDRSNKSGTIDIWSLSYERGLLFLLAFFLTRSKYWKKCQIRLFILTLNEDNQKMVDEIYKFLFRYRLLSIQKQDIEVIQIHPETIDNFIHGGRRNTDILKKINPNDHEQKTQPSKHQSENLNINNEKQPQKTLSDMTFAQTKTLNSFILKKSKEADLVLMNLPPVSGNSASSYCEYLYNLSFGLKRVIMVKNDKFDVITEFT